MAMAFVDSTAHPAAAPFYRQFPQEPTGSGKGFITIDKAYEIAPMTFESLLDNIGAKAASGGDVLIVSHGTTNGLSIKLLQGAAFKIGDIGAMDAIMNDSVSDAAKRLKLSEGQVTTLREKLEKVRALAINHLALRACKVGSYETTMGQIKKLFGAASISAPMKRDAYFFLDPIKKGYATAESLWTAWSRDHPTDPIENFAPDRFAIRTEGGDDGTHSFTPYDLAESAKGIVQWVQKHYFGSESFSYSRGSIALHGMWASPLIFPKDTDYLTYLRYFIKLEDW